MDLLLNLIFDVRPGIDCLRMREIITDILLITRRKYAYPRKSRAEIEYRLLSDAFTKSVEQLLLAPKCSPKSQTLVYRKINALTAPLR